LRLKCSLLIGYEFNAIAGNVFAIFEACHRQAGFAAISEALMALTGSVVTNSSL
jgi:hypothetical protein